MTKLLDGWDKTEEHWWSDLSLDQVIELLRNWPQLDSVVALSATVGSACHGLAKNVVQFTGYCDTVLDVISAADVDDDDEDRYTVKYRPDAAFSFLTIENAPAKNRRPLVEELVTSQ